MKKATVIIYNSELWGNKLDGLRMRMVRSHIVNCKIRQNIHGAIFLEGKLSEQLMKIYSDNNHMSDIKGKILCEQGLIYPRILV
jgi:hypothetical protein